MHREKRRNKIIILILVGIICLMGVGYAAFQTRLNITGTSEISSDWNIRIISADVTEVGGDGENVKNNYSDLTADLEANLYNKGDYVEYSIIVENAGTFDAKLETLGITNSNNEAVKITSSGLTKGQTLYKNTTATLKVRIEYNNAYEGDASGTSGESTVDLEFTQNSGGTIEPTVDHLVTYDYTTNGGESTNAENAYIAEGESINLSYTATKEGYDFVGWNTNKDASEGLTSLNMGTEDVTLYAIFKIIDTTPPVIDNISTTSTTNSITVVTTASDDIGEITKYEYSIDSNEYVEGSNSYTFNNLTQNTSHTIRVRVTNTEGLTTESEEKEVQTSVLNKPTFSEVETDSGKTVTITYPEGEGLIYEYQKDSGSWTSATQSQQVEFTESGTLVARVADGTNTETATYSVEVKQDSAGSDLVDQAGTVTSGDGLYVDGYEDNVYTYRGSNPNNYVTFNGESWRIVSANTSDNTIKIIRSSILEDRKYDTSSNGRYNSSQYCNHSRYGCNIYGSTSSLYNSSGSAISTLARQVNGTKYQLPSKESEMSTYLNGTYYNSLNATARSMIVNGEYKAAPVISKSISIISEQIGYASEAIWKGKVGLLDATEYMRATTGSSVSSDNWLHISDNFWTMTPKSYSTSYTVWFVRSYGDFSTSYAYLTDGVRPVVTLSSNIQITGGVGTSSDPYTLGI